MSRRSWAECLEQNKCPTVNKNAAEGLNWKVTCQFSSIFGGSIFKIQNAISRQPFLLVYRTDSSIRFTTDRRHFQLFKLFVIILYSCGNIIKNFNTFWFLALFNLLTVCPSNELLWQEEKVFNEHTAMHEKFVCIDGNKRRRKLHRGIVRQKPLVFFYSISFSFAF